MLEWAPTDGGVWSDGHYGYTKGRYEMVQHAGSAPTVLGREMWIGILWVGIVMALVSLVALDLGLDGGFLGGSGDVDKARTMAFTTLVLAQLFNCFNARSDRTSAFQHLFTNRLLWGAIALSAALQAAVVRLPSLNDAFHTAPLQIDDWLICVGLASVVLWADEAKKLLERWWRASWSALRVGSTSRCCPRALGSSSRTAPHHTSPKTNCALR